MCKEAREKPHDRNATESARAVKEAPAIIENIIKDLESGKLDFISGKNAYRVYTFFYQFLYDFSSFVWTHGPTTQ